MMGEWEVRAFAPGRTELAGNHQDHQGGRVVSATVSQGVEVLARRNAEGVARVRSRGYMPFEIDVGDATVLPEEANTSAGLVRGVIAGLREARVPVGGFDAQVSTTLPPGGGLSSSAAFEMAVGRAVEALSGACPMEPLGMARIGQRAENAFFGKPCGLQDQSVIACGGIVALDFSDPAAPTARPVAFDFAAHGHAVCLVDTRCDHSRFNDRFAQLVNDMNDVAAFFGAAVLGEVPEDVFLARFRDVARKLGDRAALRALHFYNELELVVVRETALRAGDMAAFLEATRRSAVSSAQYLQNVSVPGSDRQPAMVALALADRLLGGRGAVRIHGGGFGGTIQAYVPLDMLDAFAEGIEEALGRGTCNVVGLSDEGARAEWL